MVRLAPWIALLVVWLLARGTAWAQVEEINAPPASAPARPAAAPAPAADSEPAPRPDVTLRTRYSRYRTSWYIGFAVGAGAGWVRADEGDEGGGGMTFSVLRVGWVARPWLLLGFEGSTWFTIVLQIFGDEPWVQTAHYDAVATYFPLQDSGFYLKGGLGGGLAMVERRNYLGTKTEQSKDAGFDLKLGLGYEWQILRAFNLGADLSYAGIVFAGGSAHDLMAQVTFTWY